MILSFKIPAGFNEAFDKHAFDRSIGKTIHTKDFGEAVVKSVEVAENGSFAIFTIDTTKRIKVGRGSYVKAEEE